jgi:uncharacterized protein (TIGR02246 family)
LELSVEDHIAIQQLYARYTTTYDMRDLDGYLACWTEDGELVLPPGWEELGVHTGNPTGHDGIRKSTEYFFGWRSKGYHWNTSIVIEPSDLGARGSCYLMHVRQTEPPLDPNGHCQVRMALHYKDELVKQDGKWLFRRRTIHAHQ